LSWDDVERDVQGKQSGRNVVIHEIAHKLDMLNGSANGFPPLHYGMEITRWTASLSTAYQSLVRRVEHHHRACINPYAATNPAEFFAVISEYFFFVRLKLFIRTLLMFTNNFNCIIVRIHCGVFITSKQLNGFSVLPA